MYNEKTKKKFIRSYTTSINTAKVCEVLFNAIQPFEEEWGADICEKTSEELQPAIDCIVGLRVRSKWGRLIILKDYVKWCMNTGVQGACDGMLNITGVGLGKVKIQTVSNPTHLDKYLNTICVPEERETVDNIYRVYYWLAYAGMSEEDILNTRSSDVDLANLRVRCPSDGGFVPIYPESIKSIRKCKELSYFKYEHPNYSDVIMRDRVEGDLLLRGVRAQTTSKSIRVELSRRSKKNEDKTDLKLSHFRVWISGVFYRMNELEAAGYEPDFNSIVEKQMTGKTYKLDSGRNTIDAKKRQLVRDYENDYERWKLAWIYRA